MISLVITTINNNDIIKNYIEESKKRNFNLILIGDRKSKEIKYENFFSIDSQYEIESKVAKLIPENQYSRKNIGYLLSKNSSLIFETDDDNIPYDNFWELPELNRSCGVIQSDKWINIYSFFTNEKVWPRGISLNHINNKAYKLIFKKNKCPIQQRLADLNPDVDAIYRLINTQDVRFGKGEFSIEKNTYSPFNSQNTVWFKEVFPLLYLPTYCSFRMTDIYRSFIAQKILWTIDSNVLFAEPSVYQIRNEHNIMSDFEQEIEGYIGVNKFIEILDNLELRKGHENLTDNLIICYKELIKKGFFDEKELIILKEWIKEIK